jgi:hypothetical protein
MRTADLIIVGALLVNLFLFTYARYYVASPQQLAAAAASNQQASQNNSLLALLASSVSLFSLLIQGILISFLLSFYIYNRKNKFQAEMIAMIAFITLLMLDLFIVGGIL